MIKMATNIPRPGERNTSINALELEQLKQELKQEIMKAVTEEQNEWKYQRAKDRQRITTVELALDAVNTGRRNYNAFASKLLRELQKRKTAMDYRDIRNSFRFNADEESYRLMRLTAKNYPAECKIINASNKKRNTSIVYIP